MKNFSKLLKARVVRRLKAAGIDWGKVERDASQIIVFGSHALASNKPGSDLDVLCVGSGQTYKSAKLHLIWIPENKTRSRKWLRSELATHVAAYGKWVKGRNTWAHITSPSRSTILRKRENVFARLSALERHWDALLPSFQNRQLLKLRRDMQRFQMMRNGLPPVPKTILDSEWKSRNHSSGITSLIGANTNIGKNLNKFLCKKGIAITTL